MMMKLLLQIAICLASLLGAKPLFADGSGANPEFYRSLTLKVRESGSFKVAMPNGNDMGFSYAFQFGAPVYAEPVWTDVYPDETSDRFIRKFWDRILLQDGSALAIGADKIPLTCIYLEGQDNRFSSKDSPLTPDFVLKVTLVANDFTCTGPINPGWPANGGRKETWDTFFYFEIRDPTIMLPSESKIRYRWNEFPAVVVDNGGSNP